MNRYELLTMKAKLLAGEVSPCPGDGYAPSLWVVRVACASGEKLGFVTDERPSLDEMSTKRVFSIRDVDGSDNIVFNEGVESVSVKPAAWQKIPAAMDPLMRPVTEQTGKHLLPPLPRA